jgi:hypothetical protein
MRAERAGRTRWAVPLLVCVAMAVPAPARGDSRVWLTSLTYESPTLVAPVLVLVSSDDDSGREWRLGVTGWTLGAGWKVTKSPRLRRQIFAQVTPFNAHASNYIYRDGRRDPSASYSAASVLVGGGVEVVHTRRWIGTYRAVGLYEHIDASQTPDIRAFWKHPFAGVDVTESYTRVSAEDLLGTRWEGLKAEALVQVYAGADTWSRIRAYAEGGRRSGRVFVSGRAAMFGGRSLNKVSTFVLGGSWDLPAPDLLPGYHYGELRVDRGATIGGRLDIRLRGTWELGVRNTYLKGRQVDEIGTAVQMLTVWNGAVLTAGVALPKAAFSHGAQGHAFAFATITAGFIQR